MSCRFSILILSFSILLFASCSHNQQVVHPSDYDKYLQPEDSKKLNAIDEEMGFWREKLSKNPEDMAAQIKIASLLTRRFAYSGNIKEVHSADSLMRIVNKINKFSSSSTYRSLAANDITQHRFREAGDFIDTALMMGDNKYISVLMEIDVAMELGNTLRAKTALASLKDKNDFAYKVRKAKMLDHDGRGEEAIKVLESTLPQLNPETDKANYLWIKTNLGDWLGHNNHFRESYASYLDALQVDSENYHALKGIAWLAFAHDKNTTEAKRILYFLMKKHQVPDYKLMMGEIAAYENNEAEKQKWYSAFLAEVSNPLYGEMYNKYVFSLAADELKKPEEAMRIAEREVNNRPTALSYDMLAYAYYKSGNIDKACNIVKNYVDGKCFEPFSIYHQGMIYKAAGEKNKAAKYLSQAYENGFELGPSKTLLIKKALS